MASCISCCRSCQMHSADTTSSKPEKERPSEEQRAKQEVKIKLSPPKALDVKRKPSVVTEEDMPLSSALLLEGAWIWMVFLLIATSLSLSIVSLKEDSTNWLESDGHGCAGWREGCLDHELENSGGIVPCREGDPRRSIENAVDSQAGSLGQSIFVVSLAAWILPLLVMMGSSCFESMRGTCCHGFSISLIWSLAGMALIALALSFRHAVNDHIDSLTPVRLSVTCIATNSSDEIPVCTDVPDLIECPANCRITQEEDVICTGFRDCLVQERPGTCDQDGIGCEMSIGWAMTVSLVSSALMVFTGLLLGSGSWYLSRDL